MVSLSILDFGAVSSDNLVTSAIQSAIDACHEAGGGEVVVPEGTYRTGSLFLKSHVTLHLLSGAELEGSRRPEDYVGERRWYRALITGRDVEDIGIVGEKYSRINGMNCYDPEGEERYRGPHGIVLENCSHVTLSGYTVKDSGNWAHALFHCKDMRLSGVRAYGGHDGIDIHCCEDTVIENCAVYTGDDGIAGFGNYHCVIRDCVLDSSCSFARFGGLDCLFERCTSPNPATYGHRWKMSDEAKRLGLNDGTQTRHGTISMFMYYCDTRWTLTQTPGNIVFRDCDIDGIARLMVMGYDGRNQWCCYKPLTSVTFENCRIRNILEPMAVTADPDEPISIEFRNCTLAAAPGSGDRALGSILNFRRILFENTTLEGFDAPHIIIRSKGDVEVRGGTPVEVRYQPDPNDALYTFEEIKEKLSALPSDDAGWQAAAAALATPDESLWDPQTRMYRLAGAASEHTVWASVMAVFRGETAHVKEISHCCAARYGYYIGSRDGQNNLVASDIRGELSDVPCGPFAYALALDMPIRARAYMTDFLRSKEFSPVAVAGLKAAIKRLVP